MTYVEETGPFFIFKDGYPVKARHVRNVLHRAVNTIGLNSFMYDTHSFCIGRASDLMRMGVSVNKIKAVGRWRSNSVYRYLRN